MAARGARPKARPIRRTRHSRDDSDIYAALNDFTDAIEAMPSELVRQFTLLREVDAKYSDLQNKISTEIDAFFQTSKQSTPIQRNIQLVNITRMLTSALGCADEKVSVASIAADISDRHKLRLDTDFGRLESGEIAELIRFGPADHPAFVHGSTMGMSRSESRRLALAQAKKNDEELQEFRKEQIGRRGQLVANEEKAASARGAAARKKVMAIAAGPGPGGGGSGGALNGVGLGFSGLGTLGGKGTPPRGATPVATAALVGGGAGEMKKSHHKKKPRDNEENTSTTANAGQKRKHLNQYSNSSLSNRQIMPVNAKSLLGGTGGDPDEDEFVQNDGIQGDEARYCYCNQVSYGEMVACDRDGCTKEWFHLECAGLREPPKGEWFCRDCRKGMERENRRGQQTKKARIDNGKGGMR